ncbi:MAG: rod shape-determining protein RodA [Patescibacteria group bacterium]|jgi:rod shape determining protein RodA
MINFFSRPRGFDWVLALSTFLLICFGLVAIYGVTLAGETPNWDLLTKQLVAFGLGLILFFIFSSIDYQILKSYARYFYVFGLILMAAVLLFGSTIRGTKGWFSFGVLNFQPVELVKIAVIVILAYYFSHRPRPLNQFKYFFVSGLIVLVPFVLTMLQPDFGSALILFFIWLGLIFLIGPRKYQWLIFIIGGLLTFVVLWDFVFLDYQKDRLTTFLNPAADPLGSGYNVTQSMIAIGSGGWTGMGISFGSQSQLKFLPEAQTDFVFAVIAEELGLLGVIFLLTIFLFLFYRLGQIAKKCRDDFALFLILGIMVLLFIQMIMNIGMNLGIAPVTGVTLPLVSYGGSSLIFTLMLLGIAESVKIRS